MNDTKLPKYVVSAKMLEEFLAKRKRHGEKMEDLYLVVPVNKDEEGELYVETPFGKLLCILCHDLQQFQAFGAEYAKVLLLNKRKYPYPKINRVKGLKK